MIKCIVCTDRAWGIGKNNSLLFNLPSDMKFFKETTTNNIVVMGYTTYMSLPKRPLPNRENIVLWDKAESVDSLPGAITFNNFNDLLAFVKNRSKDKDVYICGGGSVYTLFLEYYDEVYVTHVDAIDKDATVFFPNLESRKDFTKTIINKISENNYNLTFTKYTKIV